MKCDLGSPMVVDGTKLCRLIVKHDIVTDEAVPSYINGEYMSICLCEYTYIFCSFNIHCASARLILHKLRGVYIICTDIEKCACA